MDLGTKFLRGVSGWLSFEFQCHRAHVFSEKYLSVPVGQLLSSYYGTQVYAEVRHPLLAPLMVGAGRRPEVDYAVLDPYSTFKVAIESKWYGDTPVKLKDAVWDVIRLALIHKYNPDCICYFMIGGQKKAIDELFALPGFDCTNPQPSKRAILPSLPDMKTLTRLDSPLDYQVEMFREMFKKVQDIDLPGKVKVVHLGRMPQESSNYEYQIVVWKVSSGGVSFKAKNHKYYRFNITNESLDPT